MMRHVPYVLVALVCLAAGSDSPAQTDIRFERDVLPILKEHCIDCHGADEAESRLRLDSPTAALRGGDSGEKTIVPGHSERSYLMERVTQADPATRMPPDQDALPPSQIATLKAWIDDAQQWTDAQQAVRQQKLNHWSFQPLVRPDVPDNPLAAIDAFVKVRLNESGLQMSPSADRRRLIRRLFLVMHGLPPTPEQVEVFVADDRKDAWERLVEDVLNSPRYGERWAQHWLDLVRFGETNGFETNRERPNAWPYRDWVIDAFNNDKPYNEFIVEQIAGDAVGAPIGTGFLVAGPVDIVKGRNPELQQMQRQDELADIINATSTAFLGMTVGCARCHNHKFDPITQTDYYAMQAVFAGVQHGETALPLPDAVQQQIAVMDDGIAQIRQRLKKYVSRRTLREAVTAKRNEEQFPPQAAKFVRFTVNATNGGQPCLDELEVFAGDRNVALAAAGATATSSGDFEHPLHKLAHVNDGRFGNARSWISAQATGGWVQIEFSEQVRIDRIVWARDREGKYADRLATDYLIEASTDGKAWCTVASSADRSVFSAGASDSVTYDFAAFSDDEAEAGRDLLKQLETLTQRRSALNRPSMVYAGSFVQPEATHRLYRGEPGSPREQVSPAGIASLQAPTLAQDSLEQQRRLTIAQWIADDQNPLTARVLVNRLWQFQFGTGIVDTPSDFGANGTQPSHPLLLDWLAAEFVDSGWSVKHIQRLILLSNTWQQDSQPEPQAMQVDASSRLLWRFPPRRLEAEAIRDCMLAVTGSLDATTGGPGFSAFEVSLENVRHYFPKKDYGPDDWRRMVYQTKVRQERDSVFGVFDCPDASSVTPRRSRSTTPLQALNLFNSRFVMQQAERFARRLDAECDSPQAAIARAYELCFGRSPGDVEMMAATDFVAATDWSQFARAMLNANEFVFLP